MLAERAALALYDASRLDAEALSRHDLTWQTADLLDRRRSRAHARALAAVRCLAVVRRLLKRGPRCGCRGSGERGSGIAAA